MINGHLEIRMKAMDTFIFPGQGSQKVGMGAGLFDEVAEFREAEAAIDQLLGYSIRELCLQDPEKKLQQTQYTQPALYVVNALHYYKALAQGLKPRLLAGHSLGEYNALHAAGVFDFVTGVTLVQKRGELMGAVRDGAMAAVLNLEAALVTKVIAENQLSELDVANFNSPVQTVISGPRPVLERAQAIFEAAGARYVLLNVSAAFHSRYMQAAADSFDQFLTSFNFQPGQIPVISNVTARPYPTSGDNATVRALLVQQISSPVQWTRSVFYLMGRGASVFHEMGPGNVLSKLVLQIQKG
jgi:malonyl CoA-acyl carrier protein transacylase